MRTGCGVKQQSPGYRFITDQYDHLQVILVLEGELLLHVHESVTPVHPGYACLLPVGSVFSLSCADTAYRGVFVGIHDAAPPAYQGEAVVLRATPEMRVLAGLIETEAHRPGYRSEAMLRPVSLALAELALRGRRNNSARQAVSPDSWVERARATIEQHIYTDGPVETILSGLGLGYRQLSRHFKAVLGVTPKQYQMACRLSRAKQLLTETSLSITSIALELGFSSSQHFCAQFARGEGMPPTAYRTGSLGESGLNSRL